MGENRVNLIINYLPQGLTDNELYKTFGVVGTIKSCRIMRDMKTGYSFGYGFIEYVNPEDAAKAIAQLNNLQMQHKTIKVSYARPPSEDIKDTNLYIQHLPRFYSEEELEKLFSPYGKIVQKSILKDKITGIPRGIGFVRYDKKSQAQAAIEAMNGHTPHDGNEALVVRLAEDHGKLRGTAINMGGAMRGGYGGPSGFGRGGFNDFNSYNNGGGGGGGYGGRGGYNNAGGKMHSGRAPKRFHPWEDPMGGNFTQYFGTHSLAGTSYTQF